MEAPSGACTHIGRMAAAMSAYTKVVLQHNIRRVSWHLYIVVPQSSDLLLQKLSPAGTQRAQAWQVGSQTNGKE